MPAKKAKKKKIVKEDAKAKKKAIARQKAEAKKRKKDNTNKIKIDPTFGLKNKKGSKNRRFVANSYANMNAEEIQKKKYREQQKREKQMLARMQAEQDALFNTVDDDPQFKKKHKDSDAQIEEKKVELDDETLLNNCAPDELDILIDKLRIKFEKRTDLTPVNEKTFKEWLDRRAAEKAAEKEAKAKRKKKKGKKGLTGKELFLVTPTMFKDDENACANDEIVFEKNKTNENSNGDKGNEAKEEIAAVTDVGDASLFLDMDDMLDGMDMIEESFPTLVTKEYLFKSVDNESNEIVCLDKDFNDVVFDLSLSKSDVLERINAVIEEGNKQKKDVTITVTEKNGNDKVLIVSDAKMT